MTLYQKLRKWWVGYKLLTRRESYLNTTGFIKSHQLIEPVNEKGAPIPWMNYAIVELLTDRLSKDLRMFEYGAGFSTQYFARLVKEVVSIEYDRAWEDEVKKQLKGLGNVTLLFEEVGTAYVEACVNQNEPFDIIIVDGRERVSCAEAGFKALTERGVLILDDSDREEYQEVFAVAKEAGFKELTISGIKPFSFKFEASTIFYRSGNCLGI